MTTYADDHRLARISAYRPFPWVFIKNGSGKSGDPTPYGAVYAADSDPAIDAPVLSGDEDTCRLLVSLVNEAERLRQRSLLTACGVTPCRQHGPFGNCIQCDCEPPL